MAELIAIDTAAANSADFTLVDGQSTTLHLKSAIGPEIPPNSTAYVQIKSGTEYFSVGRLDPSAAAKVLSGPGTFRVSKVASSVGQAAFGVDRD